jgi:hypothetical protein
MEIYSKAEAQQRADRVDAFRTELETLEKEGVVSLDAEQRVAVAAYHRDLLTRLASVFDIDTSHREKQLSLGMKIASFLGALGLGASVFFLFYRFWGHFSTLTQLFVLIAAPLLALAAMMLVSAREKTGYFSKLLAMVGLVCFVLDLSMIGQIFNIASSPNAFFVWASFAILVAYAADARLLLGMGIIFLTMFLSAKTGTWSGVYWIGFGQRPENFFPAAAVLFGLSFIPHGRFSDFRPVYRVFALIIVFLPMLILSHFGAVSYLTMENDTIEGLYQVAGFVLSAAAIWLGVRRGFGDVVNTGNVFFTLFLYTKFYDWWWEWMPKYLFFLIIGLSAVLMLFVFKRLRAAYADAAEEMQ